MSDGLAAGVGGLDALRRAAERAVVGFLGDICGRKAMRRMSVSPNAGEAATLTLGGLAALAVCGVRPHAGAGVLVEVEAGRARRLDRVVVDAVVEDVADARVGVSEESVLAQAPLVLALGLLEQGAAAAVDVERLVAAVDQFARLVEHQAVRAELLRRDAVVALVVFITLRRITELASLVVLAHVLRVGRRYLRGDCNNKRIPSVSFDIHKFSEFDPITSNKKLFS